MDLAKFNIIFQIVDAIVTAAVGVYVYLSNKDKVTNDRIGELEKNVDSRVDEHGERLARLEEAAHHVPTHDDLGRIHQRIDEAVKGVNALTGKADAMNNTLMLIQQHLLNGGSKS
ncbi:MAG: hypothetical protein VB138_03975 [Burkholderia sp.]